MVLGLLTEPDRPAEVTVHCQDPVTGRPVTATAPEDSPALPEIREQLRLHQQNPLANEHPYILIEEFDAGPGLPPGLRAVNDSYLFPPVSQ